jgi:TonB family protein
MPQTQFDPFAQPSAVPRLLIELPPRARVFGNNLRDLIFRSRLLPLELRSAPAPFWHDVFVEGGLPWYSFLSSVGCHILAVTVMIAFVRLFALQPHAVARPVFDQAQMVYYQTSDSLPPLDTRKPRRTRPRQPDPGIAHQAVISVPRESDNRSQTVVTPPKVRLKDDLALPNIVAWSDREEKPTLAIPAAPLTLAAELNRAAPRLENSVVTPPPDAAQLADRRRHATLQASVVAPPPELPVTRGASVLNAPQPAVVAPPPLVENASHRHAGQLDIAQSAVIAPAPQLMLAEQRTLIDGHSSRRLRSAVVPPPPSIAASAGHAFGSRGRMIALNLHPAVGAPPDPPAGNRRGTFAATPEGRSGASGSPGSSSGWRNSSDSNRGPNRSSGIPGGLYVGNAPAAKTSAVSGDSASTPSSNLVNPKLLASLRPPRLSGAATQTMQPAQFSNLTEVERQVFGGRKFYSLTLNMPNLNSAGGSWIIRFAELKQNESSTSQNLTAADLAQPVVTRKVDPAYPLQLMQQNVSGTVILYAVIHADGSVGNVRVLRGVDPRLDRFAREAVSRWQFQPATKNGSPVDVEATFHVPFRPGQQNF